MTMAVIDIKWAYVYAAARREVFIEITDEDKNGDESGMIGRLNLSRYGTRDAAQNWSEEHTGFLERIGLLKEGHPRAIFITLVVICH